MRALVRFGVARAERCARRVGGRDRVGRAVRPRVRPRRRCRCRRPRRRRRSARRDRSRSRSSGAAKAIVSSASMAVPSGDAAVGVEAGRDDRARRSECPPRSPCAIELGGRPVTSPPRPVPKSASTTAAGAAERARERLELRRPSPAGPCRRARCQACSFARASPRISLGATARIDVDPHPLLLERAGDDEAVAAVVALPRHDHDAVLPDVRKAREQDRGGTRRRRAPSSTRRERRSARS